MHESIRHLRLDRRLLTRRDWISDPELDQELAALPDVADKGVPLGEEAEEPEAEHAE
ncbi:MAG: hypothetical protein JSU66_11200 [Deltaproteobacteria bacterium]|nr:MAG: hypothetical protein JSU66_11200 [Deltaproteobacteria bacterium]